jgi:hypothetical protein
MQKKDCLFLILNIILFLGNRILGEKIDETRNRGHTRCFPMTENYRFCLRLR